MRAVRIVLLGAALAMFVPAGAAPLENPLLDVNPFIGTTVSFDGTDVVDDFPGADVPFGMVQWSPDTPSQNAGGGYEYQDKTITGFGLTHLAGPGCSVFGDFDILPTVGPVTEPAKAAQPFDHASERAAPGYYEVTLGNPGIRSQLTVTKRTGLGAFTFPASPQANLLFNVSSNQSGVDDAGIDVDGSDSIRGFARTGHFCGMPDEYDVYFVAKFDRPFASYGTWRNGAISAASRSSRGAGSGAWVTFDTSRNPVVRVKVGLSFTGYDGARANLQAEARTWDLASEQNAAAAAWQKMLRRISIAGGTPGERTIFYTALYHALLHPNVESDVTGTYPGFDGAIHHARPGHEEYANFSGWDIYRTQASLMALLAPRETSDAAQSLVDAARQGGWLPKWPLVNGYSAVMAGDPADTILATYYAFGARGFDTRGALQAMVKGSSVPNGAAGQGWYPERPGIDEYVARGYVSNTHMTNVSPVPNGASETQEYASADFSIAQFARNLGDMPVYHRYLQRSQNWANVFDTATGYMAGRDADGAFMQTPITADGQSGFQEGNSAQYTWMVPQDFADLVRGIGGPQATAQRLETYFSKLNAGQDKPYAWLGNEPSIIDPFVYLALGMPARQEAIVRQVQLNLWSNTPQGQGGNDDLGTMSAWYVWSAIGLFPVNPAVRGFAITTPLFKRVSIDVPGQPRIEIVAPGAADDAAYIQDVHVNGKAYDRSWIDLPQRSRLNLRFDVGSGAATRWAADSAAAPPSYRETPVVFPPASLAVLSAPDTNTGLRAGDSAAVSVTLSLPQDAAAASITWHAHAPGGIRVQPDTGAVALQPGAQQRIDATVAADSSQAPGYYDVDFSAVASNGAVLSRAVVPVHIAGGAAPLYVADEWASAITPIDPQTRATAAQISVGKGPRALALTPDRKRLFVLDTDDQTLSVVDTAQGRAVATLPVNKGTGAMALTQDGRTLWLADGDAGTLQAFDTASMHFDTPIKLGTSPGRIAIAPDGRTIYYSDWQDAAVVPFDVRSQLAGTPIAVNHPGALAVSPDGAKLYICEPPDHAVAAIDLRRAAVAATILAGVEPRSIAVSPDGRTVLVSNYFAGTVSQIDAASNALVRTIPIGGGASGIAFANDGRTAFAVAHEDQLVVPIDLVTGAKAAPIRVDVGPGPIAGP